MTKQFRLIIFIVAGLIPQLLFSQKADEIKECYRDTVPDKSEVFVRMGNKPYFKGGQDSLLNYLMTNINYQKLVTDLKQNERVYNDTARVRFIISREEIISNLSVSMTKKEIFRDEIFRTIKKSACTWKPGGFGNYVDGWFQMDIFYSIDRRYNEVTSKVKIKEYDHITDN